MSVGSWLKGATNKGLSIWSGIDPILGGKIQTDANTLQSIAGINNGVSSPGMPSIAPSVTLPDHSAVYNAAYGAPDDPYYQFQTGVQALTGSPNGVVTVGGKTLIAPQAPGLIGQQDAARATALGSIQGNNNQYITDAQAQLDNLRSQFASLNAGDTSAYQNMVDAVNGVQLAPLSLASSNPQDVARQEQAYGMLMGAAGGSLDVTTNPEDLAAQQKARDLLWSLGSSPQVTAQEQFLYEQQRLKEEQDRSAAMDAALRNLASRGMLGGGGELGAMLGAQQTTSENRLLGDLGTQAGAVARQMNALNQYQALATNMRNESDAVSAGNSDRRLSGMNGAANTATSMRNASDAIAQFNAGQTNNYNVANANLGLEKAQIPYQGQLQLSGAVGGRANQLTNTGLGVAASTRDAANLVPSLQYGAAGQDLQTGLQIAGQEDNWTLQRQQAAQAAADRALSYQMFQQGIAAAQPKKKTGLGAIPIVGGLLGG
jgi:hypothetical protein